MAANIRAGGNDLDSLFAPYTSGTKVAATSIRVGSQDLADRYQPRGGATPIANTGIRAGGTDLAQLFAPSGSTGIVAVPGYNGGNYQSTNGAASGPVTAAINFALNSNGTFTVSGVAVATVAGNWYLPTTGGIGSGYEARVALTTLEATGEGVSLTNPLSSFVALGSDRTLSLETVRTLAGASRYRYTAVVEIRPTGGAVVSTATFEIGVVAEILV